MGVDDGDEDRECGRCHETMHIPPGAEPSEFCHDCAHSLVDELRAERDQFKAMWERDSTALGKALAQRDTARTDAEDKRARVAELQKMRQSELAYVVSIAKTVRGSRFDSAQDQLTDLIDWAGSRATVEIPASSAPVGMEGA